MESLADAVCDYILLQRDVDITEDELFVGEMPASPANCITFYDSVGLPPQRDTTIYASMQVKTRNENYLAGYNKSMEIFDILRDKYSYWIKQDILWAIKSEPQGVPGFINKEEDNFFFSGNYNLWVKYY